MSKKVTFVLVNNSKQKVTFYHDKMLAFDCYHLQENF